MLNPAVMTESVNVNQTPFERMGGDANVRALAERFYDAMDEQEPELAALHPLENGKVSRASRDKFALFLIGWLGGPQDYMRIYGHPRLRMRHAHVPVTQGMRDAWMRSMRRALAVETIDPTLRAFLDEKLSDLADFLRNQP
jgi:hemoglobin